MTEVQQRSALNVSRLVVPESLDSPDAGPFLDMVRIANAVCLADAGHDYLNEQPEEVFGFWQDQTDWTQIGFVVERDGESVGFVKLMISNEDGVTSLEFDLMVDPGRWGEGIEEALLAAVEGEARARGIPNIQTWTLHRPDTGRAVISPPTGYGSIPEGDRQTVFMRESGFTLEHRTVPT